MPIGNPQCLRHVSAKLFPWLFLSLFAVYACSQPAGVNQLVDHPSPYLAMHGADPVAWQDWGPAVLERARAENLPVFVSSGYFACHWCHVMQRESYRNPEIAALINRHFVPVKLDRELHPALDAYLIDFVERTHGQAGWPLNVFLTPEGYPIAGLTYLPAERFGEVLRQLVRLWSSDQDGLRATARAAAAELQRARVPQPGAHPADEAGLAEGFLALALRVGDELGGGFGHQTRFPMAPQLSALLNLQALRPNNRLAAFLTLTLDQMASQGLRDHLGGGFFRYTVDPDWQTPHFEKMLYTQALLIPLYLRAATILQRPEYRAVARDTLDFVLASFRGTQGGFIASFSAVDDQGEEGGYYLWRQAQLTRVLQPPELRVVNLAWNLNRAASLPAGNLPVQARGLEGVAERLGIPEPEARTLLDRAKAKLRLVRAARSLPADRKQLAGWNGLLLSALVAGAETLDEPSYRTAARGLRDYLVKRLWDGEQLHRARGPAGWIGAASLQDYAFVARGLADWSAFAQEDADRALALRLVREAWAGFHDASGWRLAGQPLIPGIPAEPALSDAPLPSPSATLIALSLRLAAERDDSALEQRAMAALRVGHPVAAANPFGFSGHTWLSLAAARAD